jgi:processive 1,2-diacylglycerol beta-glucosyltransferase
MILAAGAGNGHNRAGQALQKAFVADERVQQAMFIDCLKYTNDAFKEMYSHYFLEAVKKAPTLWGWAFEKTDVPWRDVNLRNWFERMNAQRLIRKIKRFKPSVCVCTHFMPALIVSRLLRKDKLRTHLSVVVTDYYVHATWMCDVFCRYFVPHEEGKMQLLGLGFPEERVDVSGIPIDPVFAEQKDRAGLLAKFGLRGDLPVVLLSAGSVGGMSAGEMIRLMETIKTPCEIVILCGRHEELRGELDGLIAERKAEFPKFRALGFTTEMDEWMTVADLLIGKPGGLTLTESLSKNLPMVIWDPIPGQEIYNSVYLLENGAGIAPTSKLTLGFKVDKVLGDKSRLERMQRAAGGLANPKAAANIVSTVMKKLNEPAVKIAKMGFD